MQPRAGGKTDMGSASIDRSARPSTRHVWFLWLFTHCLTLNTSGDTGALDLNFDPGRGADDIVRAIVVEPGGSLLLGGSFRTFDTNACAGLVRLGPDGRMDTAFAPTSDGLCNALALQTNGQFLVGGHFSEIAGAARRHLTRFHPSGELDAEFAPALAPDDSVWALAVQDDGRILVGGYLSRIGDQAIHGLTRLLPGGEPDPEFNAGAGTEEGVAALAIQPDGRILVGGDFVSFNHHARGGVVRLWPDGSVDETFDADLTGSFLRVNTIAPQAEGGVLMGGRFESVQGVSRYGIARLDESGRLDPLFAAAGALGEPHDEVSSIVVAQQDKTWVAGSFSIIANTDAPHIALLRAQGDVDPEFHPCGGVSGGVTRIAVQPDGQLLLVGDFSYVNHLRRPGVARLIGHSPSVYQFLPQEMRSQEGVPQLRFDTNPGQRYTVAASPDLETWRAWVSGTFSARSVTLPIPVRFLGEQQCFRTSAAPEATQLNRDR
jgi:uncharacterized delta-60 repeat protein